MNEGELIARIVQALDETSSWFSERERQTNEERAMSLEIRSPKVDRLAQELASATGEDIETAVERAIEERLARVPRPLPPERRAQVKALLDRLARMPVLDARSPEEIVGFGRPRQWNEGRAWPGRWRYTGRREEYRGCAFTASRS